MEIERKFTIKELPADLDRYPVKDLQQAYMNTDPVIRIRKEDDNYYMTYKGRGMLAREEYNLPLNEKSYDHLLPKCDGNVISKKRYLIPFGNYTIELDVFDALDVVDVVDDVDIVGSEHLCAVGPVGLVAVILLGVV